MPTDGGQVKNTYWEIKQRLTWTVAEFILNYIECFEPTWFTEKHWTIKSWLVIFQNGWQRRRSNQPRDKTWQNTGWWPYAYFHFAVLLLLWSWQSLAGCSVVVLTERTGEPESGLDPAERCSGWQPCQVYEESWADFQMLRWNHYWWQGRRERRRMNKLWILLGSSNTW